MVLVYERGLERLGLDLWHTTKTNSQDQMGDIQEIPYSASGTLAQIPRSERSYRGQIQKVL